MVVLDTKLKILDVAEELFGERGLNRVSIRDITDQAKVNLAAINYHFGSKDRLFLQVGLRADGIAVGGRVIGGIRVGDAGGGDSGGVVERVGR